MNIIMVKRISRINEITTTLEKMASEGLEVDEKKILIEVCLRHSCSEKTAREYLRIAKLKVAQRLIKENETNTA